MATYKSVQRSNYFRVTDGKKFRDLMEHLEAVDSPEPLRIWECEQEGETYYAFGCYATLSYCEGDCEKDKPNSWEDFVAELAKLLPDGEAVIIMGVANENLRHIAGDAEIITNRGSVCIDLEKEALQEARVLLNNDTFTTKTKY